MIMAEGSGENNNELKFQKDINETNDDKVVEPPSKLDLELDTAKCLKTTQEDHSKSVSLGCNEAPRREENPFSFKHFLKMDQPSNGGTPSPTLASETQSTTPPYHSTGARRKVYVSPVQTHNPLTLPLDGHQHLRKSKHITLDPRFVDYSQQDEQGIESSCTNDPSLASVEVAFSSQSNSMSNLFQRSFSDRDTSFQPPASPTSCSDFETSSFRQHPPRIGSSEFSSALPDFVQDHIVLEQWYSGLNSPPSSNPNLYLNKISDFNVPDKDNGRCKLLDLGRAQSEILPSHKDLPCDLTSNQGSLNRRTRSSNSKSVPLDLPNCNMPFDLPNRTSPNQLNSSPLDLPNGLYLDLTGNMGLIEDRLSHPAFDRRDIPFPLDLPLHPSDADHDGVNPHNEVPQSLPDFLSDGPIHSDRLADITLGSCENQGLNNSDDTNDSVSRLSLENDRLRRELEASRRQLSEQTQRVIQLQTQLLTARQTEGQYTARLANAMGTVEDNITQCNKRATDAEATISRLKRQIKELSSNISELKHENDVLRQGGATANWSQNAHNTQRVSHELRQAASSAEQYLRHLLTGVDNLRTLAATIDNIDQGVIQEPDDFLSQTDDAAGPEL